jgi:integrating conjugative element relaxase (TIGR03760 family)
MEIALFHRQRKKSLSVQAKSLKDLTRMLTAPQFLADSKRQVLLQKMRSYSGLEIARYESLCLSLVERLVDYCQSVPETANSYYSQAGGLVDHALNRTEAALGLFQEIISHDSPQTLSEEQMIWQYALYTAALLQGIGKLYVDYQISVFDSNGQLLKPWNPLLESLVQTGSFYDYEFQKEPELDFRRRLNLLMAKSLMPTSGFAWIASNPQVLAVWLALLHEDYRGAGTLGAILSRADAMAIQRYLRDLLARASALGQGGPYGRSGTFSGGGSESPLDKEQIIGAKFVEWLIEALDKGLIMINKAPLLMVPGGFVMCPEMYQLFVREHPEYKNWQAIQKSLLSLGLHRRGPNGAPLESRVENTQDGTMHTGIVFSEYAVVLPASATVSLAAGKESTLSATEIIHQVHNDSVSFSSQATVQHLTAAGTWHHEVSPAESKPGVSTRG